MTEMTGHKKSTAESVTEVSEILQSLKAAENDEDASLELTALLSSAVHDKEPRYNLSDIYHGLAQTETATLLDPLHVIPILLDAKDHTASDILTLTGECGSAKEAIIAVQEALERHAHTLSSEDDVDSDKTFISLERLLHLCVSSIPRLKLRKKSPTETLKPILSNLSTAVELVAPNLSSESSRLITRIICDLLSSIVEWAAAWENGSDVENIKRSCQPIFLSILEDFDPQLNLGLAKKQFGVAFPRLASMNRVSGATDDDNPSDHIIRTAENLSLNAQELTQKRSSGALVMTALLMQSSPSQPIIHNATISNFLPVLLSSLQLTTGTDASLALLLAFLCPSEANRRPQDNDPDIIPPLVYALVPLSCSSPDPQTRLIAFRTLGALVSQVPPLERMSILRELLTDETFPALRVASVGLLKDSVLEAFSQHQPEIPDSKPFSSPELLRTFGYIVLRPQPPTLFSKTATVSSLKDFVGTEEPKRLVECLSFYNVLLRRDASNVTGVHDSNQVRSTEKDFLEPMRASLKAWGALNLEAIGHHALMVVAALETSLGRVDDALRERGHSES